MTASFSIRRIVQSLCAIALLFGQICAAEPEGAHPGAAQLQQLADFFKEEILLKALRNYLTALRSPAPDSLRTAFLLSHRVTKADTVVEGGATHGHIEVEEFLKDPRSGAFESRSATYVLEWSSRDMTWSLLKATRREIGQSFDAFPALGLLSETPHFRHALAKWPRVRGSIFAEALERAMHQRLKESAAVDYASFLKAAGAVLSPQEMADAAVEGAAPVFLHFAFLPRAAEISPLLAEALAKSAGDSPNIKGIQAAAVILEAAPHEPAAEYIAEQARRATPEQRELMIPGLARAGGKAAAQMLSSMLDTEVGTVSDALTQLRKPHPEICRVFVPWALKTLDGPIDRPHLQWVAARALAKMEPAEIAKRLTKVVDPSSDEKARPLLAAAAALGEKLPRDTLIAALPRVTGTEAQLSQLRANILRMLASHHHTEDEATLRAAMNSEELEVSSVADSFAVWHGLPPLADFQPGIVEGFLPADTCPVEAIALAAAYFNSFGVPLRVGRLPWYAGSSGIEALKAVGESERAALLAEAFALDPDQPDTQGKLLQLSEKWNSLPRTVDANTARYRVKHKEQILRYKPENTATVK